MMLQKKYSIGIFLLLVIILWLNNLFFKNTSLGVITSLVYLVSFGFLVGCYFFKKKTTLEKIFLGSFLTLSLLILAGSIFYLLFNFSPPFPLLIATLLPIPFLILINDSSLVINRIKYDPQYKVISFSLFYILGAAFLFQNLFSHITLEATRSPWDILSTKYIFSFFVLTIFWVCILTYNKRPWLTVLLGSLHTFLLLSVGVILFPAGFGYDPLLHGAAEKIIFDTGSLSPKSILYIGQYTLVIIFHYLSFIPIEKINTFLLPVLFSIFVPSIALISLKHYFKTSLTNVGIAIPFLLLIPLSQFTATTPQGLSYLFLIIISFWWFIYNSDRNQSHLGLLFLLVLTTLFIHPLTGISLFIWFGLLFVIDTILAFLKIPQKQGVLTGLLFISSFIVPLFFLINNVVGNTLTTQLRLPSFSEIGFTNLWHIETASFIGQFNTFFDILYLYRFNWVLLFLATFLVGISLIKKGKLPGCRHLIVGFGITWLSSVWMMLFFSFSELISYEQNDFPYRLFLASLYFVLPIFVATFFYFWNSVKNRRYEKSVFILVIALFITSVAFVSFPRYDSYERVRSITTSSHDRDAVKYIEKISDGDSYIVLANQSVSAAAVSELGFKEYYNQHFFYPIPTGGPLYKIYLSMVYEQPLKSTAETAANLTGVDTVYFILNDYWFNSKSIAEQASKTADNVTTLADGKIQIFTFNFDK